jgi:hypothetical protein
MRGQVKPAIEFVTFLALMLYSRFAGRLIVGCGAPLLPRPPRKLTDEFRRFNLVSRHDPD